MTYSCRDSEGKTNEKEAIQRNKDKLRVEIISRYCFDKLAFGMGAKRLT